jgi:hypothetical protein
MIDRDNEVEIYRLTTEKGEKAGMVVIDYKKVQIDDCPHETSTYKSQLHSRV